MTWYDRFALVYDAGLERLYRPHRREAAAALRLGPEATVLDLACGTGQNFDALHGALGDGGHIVGLDFSTGMLKRAAARARDWPNVHLLQLDARELTHEHVAAAGGGGPLDAVLVTLGLSVVPDWETVFDHTFSLLRPGGRYVIFDVYARRWVPQSWVVTRVAQADLRRRVWEPLEQASIDFERRTLPGSAHIHGGELVLASGTRPD